MFSNSNKLLFYISLIFSISIIILLSNNILANAANISETEYTNHNYLQSLCNNSVINCLDIFIHIQKQKGDTDMNIGSIIDKVNSTRLKHGVDILSSFHTRHTKSNNLEKVVNWLNSELQKACKDNQVFFQNYTKIDQNQTFYLKNLICKKPGITGTANNNTIIIGAHYDSRASNLNNTKVRAPGADDNASGVSGLLELARILSPFNLNYNIQFVLFSGEEQGKWGSIFM